MPFIPLVNLAKFKNNKDTPKIGKVINNLDPQKLGRVKIHLPGIYEPQDEEGTNLPWVAKIPDSFLSGSTNSEFFSVPQVGSLVEVVWPYGNKFSFYKSAPYSMQTKTNKFDEDYPNTWGFTYNDFIFKVNNVTKILTITNGKGSLTMDAEGNININANNITVACNNTNITAKNTKVVSENVNISGGNVNIESATTIQGRSFMGHTHSNGNEGSPTGGVL